jgi:hypothetical protein
MKMTLKSSRPSSSSSGGCGPGAGSLMAVSRPVGWLVGIQKKMRRSSTNPLEAFKVGQAAFKVVKQCLAFRAGEIGVNRIMLATVIGVGESGGQQDKVTMWEALKSQFIIKPRFAAAAVYLRNVLKVRSHTRLESKL